MTTQSLTKRIMSGSLVLQIAIGIVAGIALSLISPGAAKGSMLLGSLLCRR
jgi:serine/threonine transporter